MLPGKCTGCKRISKVQGNEIRVMEALWDLCLHNEGSLITNKQFLRKEQFCWLHLKMKTLSSQMWFQFSKGQFYSFVAVPWWLCFCGSVLFRRASWCAFLVTMKKKRTSNPNTLWWPRETNRLRTSLGNKQRVLKIRRDFQNQLQTIKLQPQSDRSILCFC